MRFQLAPGRIRISLSGHQLHVEHVQPPRERRLRLRGRARSVDAAGVGIDERRERAESHRPCLIRRRCHAEGGDVSAGHRCLNAREDRVERQRPRARGYAPQPRIEGTVDRTLEDHGGSAERGGEQNHTDNEREPAVSQDQSLAHGISERRG